MKKNLLKIFLQITFIANFICAIILILSNLAVLLDPFIWWPIALAGLVFPLILFFTIIFLSIWLFVKPKRAIVSIVAIGLSYSNITNTFGLHSPSTFSITKEKNIIRILTWNVGLMNYTAKDSITASNNNEQILQKLKDTDPDIICLQEFFTSVIPGQQFNFLDSIANAFHYPFHYFSKDITMFDGSFASGSIIFSKHSILDSQKINYPKPFPGSAIKVSILINNDTIDIITTRLQPLQFNSNDYKELNNIKTASDKGFSGTKNIIQKIRAGYLQRGEQINIVKKLIQNSNRPLIFTGDLNDVPVSYTYYKVKGNLNDSWLKQGSGLGRTFVYISPTLRIDQIFFNRRFVEKQVTRVFADQVSDHNAVVADLILQ